MSKKASTFRLDATAQERLATLSRILRRPMNSLVNEAVEIYLDQRSREVERDLEAILARLRSYRQRDPDFEHAIAAFAEAEAGSDDPIEGRPSDEAGPVTAEIGRMLNAGLGGR